MILPKKLKLLRNRAFYKCNSLKDLSFGGNELTYIGSEVFAHTAIEKLELPDNLKSIQNDSLSEMNNLKELYLSNNISPLPFGVLYGLNNLISLSLKSTDSRGVNPPRTSSSLAVLFSSNGEIEDQAIPQSLKKVTLRNTSSLSRDTFKAMTNLTSIVVANNVSEIGTEVFSDCKKLQELEIPFLGQTETDADNCFLGYLFGATDASYNVQDVPRSLRTVKIFKGKLNEDSFLSCRDLAIVHLPANTATPKKIF